MKHDCKIQGCKIRRKILVETADAAFTQARALVEHEDSLVDRRIRWLISICGYSFAAYAASFAASVRLYDEFNPEKIWSEPAVIVFALLLSFARLGLCFLAGSVAIHGARSIGAAHHAIQAIARKHNQFLVTNAPCVRHHSLKVYKLIGDNGTTIPGASSSFKTPYILACVSVGLATISVLEFPILLLDSSGDQLPFVVVPVVLLAVIACKMISDKARRALRAQIRSAEKTGAKENSLLVNRAARISNASFVRPMNPNCSLNATPDSKDV